MARGYEQNIVEDDEEDSDDVPALLSEDSDESDEDGPVNGSRTPGGNSSTQRGAQPAAVAATAQGNGHAAGVSAIGRSGSGTQQPAAPTPTSYVQQVSVVDDSDSDEPPPLAGDVSDEDDASDDEGPPGMVDSDEDDGDYSDEGSSDASDAGDGDNPPALVTGSESDDDSDSDGPDNMEPVQPLPHTTTQSGFTPGFLNDGRNKQAKAGSAAASSSSAYANVGVGRKEAGPAASAPRPSSGSTAVPPAAGSNEYFNMSSDSYYRGRAAAQQQQQQQQQPPEHHKQQERARQAAQQQQSTAQWRTQQQKQKKPKPPAAPVNTAPQEPAEVVTANEGLAAIQREREEMRRKLQMQRVDESTLKAQPVGRCCLNRGLDGAPQWCHKDKTTALVMPDDRRIQMRCSAGCLMMWHQVCWRPFQELYEHETRDSSTGQGVNLTQALRVREPSRDKPMVRCVTEGCKGYINFLAVFEGPLGHELFRNFLYQPTQLNLAAIKQAEEQDRAQLLKEREDTKAARDAASLKAWQQKHGVRPKDPKKPRAPRPKREPAAQAAAAAGAAGARGGVAAAAAAVSALDDDELMGMLTTGASSSRATPAAAAPAAAPAALVAPAKPKGIQIKRVGNPMAARIAAQQQQQQQAGGEDEQQPGTPSTQVSGSTHATPSMDPSSSRKPKSSEPDAAAAVTLQQQLGDATASDYVDPSYHKDINEYVAVHSGAAAAAKAKGKQKKTKGVKLALDLFNELQGGPSAAAEEGPRKGPKAAAEAAAAAAIQPPPPPRQRAPRMGEFPALDEAMHGDVDASADADAEPDYLAEALNQLKIGMGEPGLTQHLLFECVDFYMIKKQGMDAAEAIISLIKSKTGKEPLLHWVFPKQEAVAVCMPDHPSSTLVLFHCQTRVEPWQRKQLRVTFLRESPWDEELHKAYPQYVPPAMAEQLRLEEELEALRQQSAQIGPKLSDEEREALAKLVREGVLTMDQLDKALEHNMTAAQAEAMAKAERKAAKAAAEAEAAAAAARKQAAAKVLSQSKAAAAAAAAPKQPGMQPLQQQTVLRQPAPPRPPAPSAAAGGATAVYGTSGTVYGTSMQVPVVLQQAAGGYVAVRGPVVMQQGIPGAVFVPAQAAGAVPGAVMGPGQQAYTLQQQLQQQWAQQQQQQQAAAARVGMQPQQQLPGGQQLTWQQHMQQQEAGGEGDYCDWEEGQEEGGEGEEAGEEEQQRGRDTGAGSSRAAAAAGSGDVRNMSLSPASKKLNAAAPEFRPSGLSVSTSSQAAPQETPAAAAADEPEEPPTTTTSAETKAAPAAAAEATEAAPSSTGSEAAGPEATAADETAVESSNTSSSTDAASSSNTAAAADGSAVQAEAAEQPKADATAESAAEAEADASPPSQAGSSTAAAGSEAGGSRPGTAGPSAAAQAATEAAAAAAEEQPASVQQAAATQQAAAAAAAAQPAAAEVAASPAPVPAGGLPADHVFDAVHLIGCTTEHLPIYRDAVRAGTNVQLPVSSFPAGGAVGVSESGGLIVFNNDTRETEGLWMGLRQENGMICWQPVAQYFGVPYDVLGGVLTASGTLKQYYPGAEGRAITQAMHDWAHPQPVQAAAVQQQPSLAGAVGAVAAAGEDTATTAAAAAASRPGSAVGAQSSQGASSSSSRPGSAGVAAAGQRALPGFLGKLQDTAAGAVQQQQPAAVQQRPASAGPAALQQQQQPPAAAAVQQQPAAAAAAGGAQKRCIKCGLQPPGWVVLQSCRHLGPCLHCLVPPANMTNRFLSKPADYPVCLACNLPVVQLLRIVM